MPESDAQGDRQRRGRWLDGTPSPQPFPTGPGIVRAVYCAWSLEPWNMNPFSVYAMLKNEGLYLIVGSFSPPLTSASHLVYGTGARYLASGENRCPFPQVWIPQKTECNEVGPFQHCRRKKRGAASHLTSSFTRVIWKLWFCHGICPVKLPAVFASLRSRVPCSSSFVGMCNLFEPAGKFHLAHLIFD